MKILIFKNCFDQYKIKYEVYKVEVSGFFRNKTKLVKEVLEFPKIVNTPSEVNNIVNNLMREYSPKATVWELFQEVETNNNGKRFDIHESKD